MAQGQRAKAWLYAAAVAGVLAVSGTALAQAPDDNAGYITLMPHYVSPDAYRRATTENGTGMTFGYGRPMGGGGWSWELNTFAERFNLAPDNAKEFERYGVGVDFNYRFREDGLSPFFVLGGGVARNDVVLTQFNDNDYYANAAFGLVTGGLGRSEIRLRTELRYVRDRFEVADEGHKNDRRLGLGIEIPLGRRTVEVEREVVREVVREVPRDVPAEIRDSDNDGVPDQNDRCPGTLQGLATDNRGCAATAEQSSVRLEGVTFELNSARLTPDATQTLRRVAEALRGEPNLRAQIAGHTDSSGDDAYNLRLSQQRAESVLQFLVSQGIDANRLQARGYGETQPVADNGTAAGRDRNRRVEFNVLN